MYNLEQKQRDLEKGKEIFMKKKLVSSAILAAALAVTSVVPAFAEGDTSEVYWYSDVAGYGPANWNTSETILDLHLIWSSRRQMQRQSLDLC